MGMVVCLVAVTLGLTNVSKIRSKSAKMGCGINNRNATGEQQSWERGHMLMMRPLQEPGTGSKRRTTL
jgi:hypothetical protein